MGRLNLLLVIAILALTRLQAQDPFYHVSTASPLVFNPAFAGSSFTDATKKTRFIIGTQHIQYGRQNDRASYFSFDQYIPSLGGAIGCIAEQHAVASGFLKISSVKGIYNYFLPLSKRMVVKAALEAGIENKSLDFSLIKFIDNGYNIFQQLPPYYAVLADNQEPMRQYSRNYLVMNSGLLVETPKASFGISLTNINRPDWSFTDARHQKPMKVNVHFQSILLKHNKFDLYLKSMFAQQYRQSQVNAGLQLKSKKWSGGLFFNRYDLYQGHFSSLMGSIGYTIRERIQLRYAAEYTDPAKGSHQTINHSVSLLVVPNFSRSKSVKPNDPILINKNRYADYTF